MIHNIYFNENNDLRCKKERKYCIKCKRPLEKNCICLYLPLKPFDLPEIDLIENKKIKVNILIIQYYKETKRKSLSSIPILSKCINDIQIYICKGKLPLYNESKIIDNFIYKANGNTFLLYPSEEALELSNCINEIKKIKNNNNFNNIPFIYLILIDGTWSETKRIFNKNKNIFEEKINKKNIFQVKISNPFIGKSIYGTLRREPKQECLSTLEAIYEALRKLDSSDQMKVICESLRIAFKGSVDLQLEFVEKGNQLSKNYWEKKLSEI